MEFAKKYIKKVSFTKSHYAFIKSGICVQILPIILLPIISRLYTSNDFGIYAVYFGIASILGGISTLSIENAIIREKRGEDCSTITIVSITVALLFATFTHILISKVDVNLINRFFGNNLNLYLSIVPFSVFLNGAYNSLYYWSIKNNLYRLLAKNKLVLAISTFLFQLVIGTLDLKVKGLIISNILGIMLGIILLLVPFIKYSIKYKYKPKIKNIIKVSKKNILLVGLTTPSSIINQIFDYIPIFFMNKFFDPTIVGQYSMAKKIISLPISYISSSLQDIFKTKASEEFIKKKNCRKSFNEFLYLLIIIGGIIIIPLIFLSPYFLPKILGNGWSESGTMIKATFLLIIIRFISGPLSYTWIIKGKYLYDLIWQICLLLIGIMSLLYTQTINNGLNPYNTLSFFSITVSLWYLVALFYSRKFSV